METETKHTITKRSLKFTTLFPVHFHFNAYGGVSVGHTKWLVVEMKKNKLRMTVTGVMSVCL
jgi:hypothetical protein